MNWQRFARPWHLMTAVVIGFALVAQLVLVFDARAVLVPGEASPLGFRLWEFVSYFTVQANILILVCAITLAIDPRRDGNGWRVLRTCVLTGITVTGLVHWFLLRPLLDLHGWSYVCDKLLHVVSPLIVVAGWLLFGPRGRITIRSILLALIWPAGWLVYTLVIGAIRGWYPYPFLNPSKGGGVGGVTIVCVLITVLFLVIALGHHLLDRRLARVQAPNP